MTTLIDDITYDVTNLNSKGQPVFKKASELIDECKNDDDGDEYTDQQVNNGNPKAKWKGKKKNTAKCSNSKKYHGSKYSKYRGKIPNYNYCAISKDKFKELFPEYIPVESQGINNPAVCKIRKLFSEIREVLGVDRKKAILLIRRIPAIFYRFLSQDDPLWPLSRIGMLGGSSCKSYARALLHQFAKILDISKAVLEKDNIDIMRRIYEKIEIPKIFSPQCSAWVKWGNTHELVALAGIICDTVNRSKANGSRLLKGKGGGKLKVMEYGFCYLNESRYPDEWKKESFGDIHLPGYQLLKEDPTLFNHLPELGASPDYVLRNYTYVQEPPIKSVKTSYMYPEGYNAEHAQPNGIDKYSRDKTHSGSICGKRKRSRKPFIGTTNKRIRVSRNNRRGKKDKVNTKKQWLPSKVFIDTSKFTSDDKKTDFKEAKIYKGTCVGEIKCNACLFKNEKTGVYVYKTREKTAIDPRHIFQMLHGYLCVPGKNKFGARLTHYFTDKSYDFHWVDIPRSIIRLWGLVLAQCSKLYQMQVNGDIVNHLDMEVYGLTTLMTLLRSEVDKINKTRRIIESYVYEKNQKIFLG